MNSEATNARRFLPPRWRHALLTAHIAMSVGLLGDSAGFLAVAIRAARTSDPILRNELVEVLNMFSLVFGIPLSVGALVSGIALGLGTKWGVFRYPWVVAKLLIIVSVMLVGSFVISPAHAAMLQGREDAAANLIVAAAYDVVALGVATWLSVFKPGRAFRSTRLTKQETA
ncbi:MAG TPA: DUF2269 family protein [Vicinamibacterales bacterium]|nr:DUF2269 family protein [Vicinamibacterales bacterium]